MSERIEVKGLLPSELEAVMVENGLERFRGRQVAQWMYGRGTTDFGDMTNLSVPTREKLSERMNILDLERVTAEEASDGSALKVLVQMRDGGRIESVLMREGRDGPSACRRRSDAPSIAASVRQARWDWSGI